MRFNNQAVHNTLQNCLLVNARSGNVKSTFEEKPFQVVNIFFLIEISFDKIKVGVDDPSDIFS